LSGTEVRDSLATKHYAPKAITGFNAEEIIGHVLTVVAKGNGTSESQKRRTFSALLRSVMGNAKS
jgi:hydrogenase maturation factor